MRIKLKLNSKLIIILLVISIIGVVSFGINYCFFSPSPVNKYIASKIYKTPANSAFIDNNFYQCVVDDYNNKNGTSLAYTTSLSDSQLKSIKILYCDNQNITDASGIKKLTALTSLHVSDNQLTSLDVSNNTALTFLDTQNNQLTSLDVSGATALTGLDVDDNQLTSLDVSKNTALKELSAYNNQLTSLDVSKNTALTRLYANENQLTSLDVSNNTALTDLWVGENQLTSLDVSKNTALTYLFADYNQLKSLDVSGATALTVLRVLDNQLTSLDVSNNTALTWLDTRKNQLTSLDVSKNIALTSLDVDNNQLTSLDVSNNTALTYLSADSNQLTSLDVSNNTALTRLYASYNQLTSLYVSKNTKLTELEADNNQLTSLDVSKNTALTILVLRKNQLTNLDVSNNIALTNLVLPGNQLTSLDVSKNIALRELHAYSNQLTSLDVSNNTALEHLWVYVNQLTSLDVSGATALTQLYAYNNQLTSLDVSNNTALKYLYAYNNQLTSLDVSKNTALTDLRVGENQLTSLDVSKNTALKYLYTYNNQLTSLDVSKNTALKYLYTYKNQLTSLDVSKNTALTYLNVDDNPFQFNLGVILLGDRLEFFNMLVKLVKLPSQLTPTVSNSLSDGLSQDGDILISTKAGTQTISRTSSFSTSNKYIETYTIEVVDVRSDVYNIDKSKDYICINGDDNDTILNNIIVENGTASIEDDYLIIKNGEEEVKRFKLIRMQSSVYDLDNQYIYVGDDIDEEIINNIETNGNISIDNNILKVGYSDNDVKSYDLVRIDTSYDVSNGYIYTLDNNILDNINVINGNKNIMDDSLIISYGDKVLDTIPILSIRSNDYIINDDYIYTKFKEFDLDKVIRINDVDLDVNGDILYIKYNNELLDTIPIYGLNINSSVIRVKSKDKIIYINENMSYKDFITGFVWNTTMERMHTNVYDSNDNIVYDGDVSEGYVFKVLYNDEVIDSYNIMYRKEYVEYDEKVNFKNTSDEGIDVLIDLNLNNTFSVLKELIDTDGVISVKDKDDNILELDSNIKTGDRFVITFPTSEYFVYLSVKGDVTGSGDIGENDVSKAYKILRRDIVVSDWYKYAGDINSDGNIKINDIAKLHQYVKNKIDSLED